jgi:two-component system KDP operon response regulator KdpE
MRILVIDDDTGMTDMLTILLTPAFSEIIVANSAPDGIRLAHESNLNVIILDLLLPEIQGWEVCKSIREFSNVPILILSAIDSPDIVAEALDNGADDYITKPVSSSTLIARLNRLVRRQGFSINNILPLVDPLPSL